MASRGAGGAPPGKMWVHAGVPPKESAHTSLTNADPFQPPKTISRSRTGSYSPACENRAGGRAPTGTIFDQAGVAPSDSAHVLLFGKSKNGDPPKMTMRLRLESNTPTWSRTGSGRSGEPLSSSHAG